MEQLKKKLNKSFFFFLLGFFLWPEESDPATIAARLKAVAHELIANNGTSGVYNDCAM